VAAINGKAILIKWITISAGLAASVFYCLYTILAIQRFPGNFSATRHYLSVLGNVNRNPDGAIFYNRGVMLTGLSLLIFYVCFVTWNALRERSKILLGILMFGSMNGFSIFMSAVYPEVPDYQKHFTWSLLIFMAFIPVLILFSLYLRRYSGLNKIISYSGFGLAAYNLIFVIYGLTEGTTSGALLEWISVFSYIGWIILNVINLMLFNKIQTKFS
jgi:hypothetical protein